jgi:hypothetical protein
MLKNGDNYKGWRITFSDSRPVTGKWRAERFGVGLSANDAELLKRMIDTRPKSWE